MRRARQILRKPGAKANDDGLWIWRGLAERQAINDGAKNDQIRHLSAGGCCGSCPIFSRYMEYVAKSSKNTAIVRMLPHLKIKNT